MADDTTKKKTTTASGGPGDPILDNETASDKGWFGSRPLVHDDSEFDLTTGPTSPGATHVPVPSPDTTEFKR